MRTVCPESCGGFEARLAGSTRTATTNVREGRGPPDVGSAGAAIVIYPAFANRVAVQAAWEALNDLHERGAEAQEDWAKRASASRWGDAFHRLAEVPPTDPLFTAEKRFLLD